MKKLSILLVFFFAVSLSSSNAADDSGSLVISDLGTLGGTASNTYDINNQGQVIGNSYTASDAEKHAFLWTPGGGMVDLGTLGGKDSYAHAINDSGQVVGYSRTTSNGERAVLWTPDGGMMNLGTLGGNYSRAIAINEAGQVIGFSYTATNERHAFFWTPEGGIVDLGTLGGDYSYASAINSSGQVVGGSRNLLGDMHAFLITPEDIDNDGAPDLWYRDTDSDGANDLMMDLGTLGGNYSLVYAINNAGLAVGSSNIVSGEYHAFFWAPGGGMVDLGTLGGSPCKAVGINDDGQVVGTSYNASGKERAFLWTPEGEMVDLGTLGGGDSHATAINDVEQVVGVSNIASGEYHAFLWTPDDGMVDLGTLGGDYSRAAVINDAGQVAGESSTAQGETHVTLWSIVNTPQCILQPGDLECILPIEDKDYDLVTGGQRYHGDSHQGIDLEFDTDEVDIIAPCDGEVIAAIEQDLGNGFFQWTVAIRHISDWYIYITFEPHTNVEADNNVQRSWINFPIIPLQDAPYQNPICIKQGDSLGKLVVRDPQIPDFDWYPHIHWTITPTGDFEDAVCPRDKLTPQAEQDLDWIYGEHCLLPVCTDVLDEDFDGITDEIDTDVDREYPIEWSNEFSDIGALGGTTTGFIVDRGHQNLRITDIPSSEPSPNGVLVTSCKYGYATPVTDAIIKTCNETATYTIWVGQPEPEFISACSSAITKVIKGTVGILHTADDGRTATLTLNEGNGLVFDPETFTFTAPDTNSETVIILVAGREISIKPGESKLIVGIGIDKARVKLHRKTDKDQFEVKGSLDLAATSDGIDILNEDVTVTLGEFSETIPAGSFALKGKAYRYNGPRGAITKMNFFDDGRFDVKAKGLNLNVESFTDPIPFFLAIDDDFGNVQIQFDRKGKFPAGGDYGDDDSDSDNDSDKDSDGDSDKDSDKDSDSDNKVKKKK